MSTEERLLSELTLEEKVGLLTGSDGWTVPGVDRLGVRPLILSDGPAGVRGTRIDRNLPSSSLPSPSALAATWDPELIRELTEALGYETRGRGVDVLLAPTINLVRTPLGGRAFECFSEDPVLTARIAVAYIAGLQEAGVAAAAKHFVGNDSETARFTYDARISEGVLHELYLRPFEACVTEANVAMVMAAYSSLNGDTMTENGSLLVDLLKHEWGFRGVVVSDWGAARSTAPAALGGLDLVMPGPDGPWGEKLVAAVRAGEVAESVIDDKVARLLWVRRVVAGPNGHHGPEAPVLVSPELLRETAARSFVLLRNEGPGGGVLPLDPASAPRIALIGPNAVRPVLQGGGSVHVFPVTGTTPADALDGSPLTVHEGCRPWLNVPPAAEGTLVDPDDGTPGVRVDVYDADGTFVYTTHQPEPALTWWDGIPDEARRPGIRAVMRTRYRSLSDGPHLIGVAGVGTLRLLIDDHVAAEDTTPPPHDAVEALSRPPELRCRVDLTIDQEIDIHFEYQPDSPWGFVAMKLGIAPAPDEDSMVADAVEAARAADVAVVVVGSAEGTESEGYDRDELSLPGRQDELVERVAEANPNTIVVVNAGAPVLLPWADDVAAVLYAWLPGQAMGEALADVLFGRAEPGGRLPVTLPRAAIDAPVTHARPIDGRIQYDEGLLIGYRGYDRARREPRYEFGHGLGYTTWDYETLEVERGSDRPGDAFVTVGVRNTGARAGREVVQAYLEPPDDAPDRPVRTLVAFTTVTADPGATATAHLTIPAAAFARYDGTAREWITRPGGYTVRVGRSSRDLRLAATVPVDARTGLAYR